MKGLAPFTWLLLVACCGCYGRLRAYRDFTPATHERACAVYGYCGARSGAYLIDGQTRRCYVDDVGRPEISVCENTENTKGAPHDH